MQIFRIFILNDGLKIQFRTNAGLSPPAGNLFNHLRFSPGYPERLAVCQPNLWVQGQRNLSGLLPRTAVDMQYAIYKL